MNRSITQYFEGRNFLKFALIVLLLIVSILSGRYIASSGNSKVIVILFLVGIMAFIGRKFGFIVVIALAFPLARYFGIIGNTLTAYRLLILFGLAMVLLFSNVNYREKIYLRLSKSVLPSIFIFIVYMFLSLLLLSPDPDYARRILVEYTFSTLLLGACVLLVLRSYLDLDRFLMMILLIGFVNAFFSWGQVLWPGSLPHVLPIGNDVTALYSVEVSESGVGVVTLFSAFGLFPARGDNALFSILPLFLSLMAYIKGYWLPRHISLLLTGFIGLGILLTNSRMGIALALFGSLLLIVFFPTRKTSSRFRLFAPILILILAIVLIANQNIPVLYSSALANLSRFAHSLSDFKIGRLNIWLGTLHTVQKFPLFGVGIGGLPEYLRGLRSTNPHNAYLELPAEIGISGLIIWSWIMFIVAKRYIDLFRAIRHINVSFDKHLAILSVFGIYFLCYLLYGVIGWSFRDGWAPITYALIIPDVLKYLIPEFQQGTGVDYPA